MSDDLFEGRPTRTSWVRSHGKRIKVVSVDPPLPKRKSSFKVNWVKLPSYWIKQLEQARHLATYKLAHRILQEAYKQRRFGGEVVLSTAVTGLPRYARLRAIRELVELGLIRTQQTGNGAVRVVELGHMDKSKRDANGK